jgi:biopolymer transport protein ExbD
MKLPRPKRRYQVDSVTPLINVVFLLLIFFMLTGTIARPDLLNIKPPEATTGSEEASKGLRIQLAADGQMAIDKRRLTLAEIGDAVAKRRQVNANFKVVIAADGNTEAGKVLNLLDALRKAGVGRISLSTVRRR